MHAEVTKGLVCWLLLLLVAHHFLTMVMTTMDLHILEPIDKSYRKVEHGLTTGIIMQDRVVPKLKAIKRRYLYSFVALAIIL